MLIAVLFRTHKWNADIQQSFDKLYSHIQNFPNIHLYILFDSDAINISQLPPYPLTFSFSRQQIINDNWQYDPNTHEHLTWFKGDYCTISFLLNHPQYNIAYTIEYDVDCNNWSTFFTHNLQAIHTHNPHLITTYLRSNIPLPTNTTLLPLHPNVEPQWFNWQFQNFTYKELLGCYFPIIALSQKAAQIIHPTLQHYKGFCEVTTPTILYHNNLTILDLKLIYPLYNQLIHKNILDFARY